MRLATLLMIIFTGSWVIWTPQSAAQNEIYRWVDENGVVHFGDRQPKQKDAEVISIPESQDVNTQPSAAGAPVEGQQAQEPQTSVAQQRRDARAADRLESEARAKVTAESCKRARLTVSQLEPSPRVNVFHEDGTVTRMDDNDRLEQLNKAKSFIAAECDN